MARGAEGEDALLGAALFLVAARAAEGDVEAVEVERLLQPLGLPHIGVERTMVERVDPAFFGFGILIDDELHAALARHAVAQFVHRLEFPRRVDMKQRERRRRRIKSLAREMEHHRAVLAHAVQHHGLGRVGHHFAHDMDTLGLEPVEMGQFQ